VPNTNERRLVRRTPISGSPRTRSRRSICGPKIFSEGGPEVETASWLAEEIAWTSKAALAEVSFGDFKKK